MAVIDIAGGSANTENGFLRGMGSVSPGDSPGYELCKAIYVYHPLGKRLVDHPIELAQSQERTISIRQSPLTAATFLQEKLIERFKTAWVKESADEHIADVLSTSRIYGAAALIVGAKGVPTDVALPLAELAKGELYYNVLDPLNAAGSLVLNQDPNAPDFQKPNFLESNGYLYHASRACVVFNEKPIYLQYSSSAFGFSGRSVYQRVLYPLRTYTMGMFTDFWVTDKVGMLVKKSMGAGSAVDNVQQAFEAQKRMQIKNGHLNNVLQIGIDESLESIDLHNLKEPYELVRANVKNDIANGTDMPANMITQEALSNSFSEGSEDAKSNAMYIQGIRNRAKSAYDFMDRIVQYRAWNLDFYNELLATPEGASVLKGTSYDEAFYAWRDCFEATWPNLLLEPDSERVKKEDVALKAAITIAEVLLPISGPNNREAVGTWIAQVANEKKLLFGAELDLDIDELNNYEPQSALKEPGFSKDQL